MGISVSATTLTAAVLTGMAGALLSLVFSYVPGIRERFEVLTGTQKRGVMALFLLLTSVTVYGLSCFSPFVLVECSEAGVWDLLLVLGAALMANQSTFSMTPKMNGGVKKENG